MYIANYVTNSYALIIKTNQSVHLVGFNKRVNWSEMHREDNFKKINSYVWSSIL
jgi:hypothetical protein